MCTPFSQIVSVDVSLIAPAPSTDAASSQLVVTMDTNGPIPFAQVVLWRGGQQALVRRASLEPGTPTRAVTRFRGEELPSGRLTLLIEGCRTDELSSARAEDWVKVTREFELPQSQAVSTVTCLRPEPGAVRVYFGIHKHMHQPYYRTTDAGYWDGGIEEVFGSRQGAYVDYLADAIERYRAGGLAHAGLSTSYSGSLIEQLERCEREGLGQGRFGGWRRRLAEAARSTTALGNPRLDLVSFGYFHPLMPLIPARDVVRQIAWHRSLLEQVLGVRASPVLFPPETAFHTRMIPALVEAGVQAVIYDSIHRFRACRDYPYRGLSEGLLPPNRAEQENPPVTDWLELSNIWAGSPISPSLLRPSMLCYTDVAGRTHQIVGVPAERYIGNEDARGGFGALQYPSVLGQVYDKIVESGTFDPAHPPFFLLHSDGDNYGGGTDSYYRHNTDGLVEWLRHDPRFELSTIRDYLARFPVDPKDVCHVEPGSWSGADNGDPQFGKWFSMQDAEYSPDLNSWAVLTALQNLVHSLEDRGLGSAELEVAVRLLLLAETSCYWYWTGQELWDRQVTEAANRAIDVLGALVDRAEQLDLTGPTIFPPWTQPANPGGQAFGNNCLIAAPRSATLHTLIYDLAGVSSASVVLRSARGEERLALRDLGAYPSRTGARRTAHHFVAELPVDRGDVRYFIEAVDGRGNQSQGSLERLFLP